MDYTKFTRDAGIWGGYSPARLVKLAFPPAAVVLILATFSTTSRVRS